MHRRLQKGGFRLDPGNHSTAETHSLEVFVPKNPNQIDSKHVVESASDRVIKSSRVSDNGYITNDVVFSAFHLKKLVQ